mmetsp:Transcript_89829/g.254539  ORF Transcript_89829/g.254539 Transcript_89829/m.254539 type:complete len:145 (-) Transcript_89829:86-520(-)
MLAKGIGRLLRISRALPGICLSLVKELRVFNVHCERILSGPDLCESLVCFFGLFEKCPEFRVQILRESAGLLEGCTERLQCPFHTLHARGQAHKIGVFFIDELDQLLTRGRVVRLEPLLQLRQGHPLSVSLHNFPCIKISAIKF